ncbi:MAG: spondin domain-containing protein [Pseudomonadota bacterium]
MLPQAHAQNLDITITNLTHGLYNTPILVGAHRADTHIFQVNSAASTQIQAMAEGGSIDALVTQLESIDAAIISNPADGLLGPGASTSITDFDTGTNTYLSIVAMLLPTNDGFIGLDAWKIPEEPGNYTVYLNAYDAGTEANNEIVVDGSGASGVLGIPANPGANGGNGATGVTTTEENNLIHIHRGALGDTDLTGGVSDLDSRIHRWLNPVTRVVVTVK